VITDLKNKKIQEINDFKDFIFMYGAGEGTRTPTVSLSILSRTRLPFRHTGL
jgi:hypothetical protein